MTHREMLPLQVVPLPPPETLFQPPRAKGLKTALPSPPTFASPQDSLNATFRDGGLFLPSKPISPEPVLSGAAHAFIPRLHTCVPGPELVAGNLTVTEQTQACPWGPSGPDGRPRVQPHTHPNQC